MPSTPDNEKYPLLPIDDQDSTIDALYCQSIHFILNTALKNITVKDIQFHFRIGYNRAANILEQIRLNNQPIK
ncbi:DNA translocase FtsK [Yersinia frederiksenii]|nr:DNA translocase FtsK [Yersinia frederiksenii]